MTIWTPNLPDEISVKYRAIADALEKDIAEGKLVAGDRLPTQRELSRHLSVTIGTVGRAYSLAEMRGLISAEVGRGSFVLGARERGPSDHFEDTTAIDFGLNRPAPIPDGKYLAQSISRLARNKDPS